MKQYSRESTELEAINYCISAVENCMRALETELRKRHTESRGHRKAIAILEHTISRLSDKRMKNEISRINRPLMTSSSGWIDELSLF